MLIFERRRGKIIDVFDESYKQLHSFHVSTVEESAELKLICKMTSPGYLPIDFELSIKDGEWQIFDATIPGRTPKLTYKMKVEVRSDKNVCILMDLPPCIKILRREVVERDGIEKYQNAARHLELI